MCSQGIGYFLAKYKLTILWAHLLSGNDVKFVIVRFIHAEGDKNCPTLQFFADGSLDDEWLMLGL